MKPAVERKAGLAGAEALFLFSLVLIVVSLAIPAWLEWRHHRRTVQAYSEIRWLVAAAQQYNLEYRLWPVADPPSRRDARFGGQRSNAEVMFALRGVEGPGNEAHRANPRQINFLEEVNTGATAARLNERGEVLDPWGRPYQMAFDSNYDNVVTIEDSSYGAVVGEGVLVWSAGPDGKLDTPRDLRSWRP